MTKWEVEYHKDFLKDLGVLDKKILNIFYKKIKKIEENPKRQKHLTGSGNFYREPITKNIRLVYVLEGKIIRLLVINKHKTVYRLFLKRFHSL